jgi:hypothetical protein
MSGRHRPREPRRPPTAVLLLKIFYYRKVRAFYNSNHWLANAYGVAALGVSTITAALLSVAVLVLRPFLLPADPMAIDSYPLQSGIQAAQPEAKQSASPPPGNLAPAAAASSKTPKVTLVGSVSPAKQPSDVTDLLQPLVESNVQPVLDYVVASTTELVAGLGAAVGLGGAAPIPGPQGER